MRHYVRACLLLVFAAGCEDLTHVPPPPVPLSALGDRPAAAAADESWSPTTNGTSVRLVRAAPADALLLVHLPDIAGAAKRLESTALYRWLNSAELKHELGPMVELFSGQLSFGDAPVDARKLKAALQGEAFVCLESVKPGDGPVPAVRALAGITVAGAEEDVERLLHLMESMAAAQKGVTVEKGTASGADFSRVVVREPTSHVIEFSLAGDALLVGYGKDTVTSALRRLADTDEMALPDTPGFVETWTRCGDPRDALRLHLDVSGALEQALPHLPADAKRAFEALALNHVRSLGVAVRFDGSDVVVASMLDSPGGKDFLTRLLAAHPVDRAFLQRIPSQARAFSLFALDGRAVLGALRTALPEEGLQEFERTLTAFRRSGFDLEKDVFDVFGPRCAVVNVPTAREGRDGALDLVWDQLLGTVLVFEVQDVERAQALLEGLPTETAFGERSEYMVEGTPVVGYRMNSSDLPADFVIACALHDDYLIVAPTDDALRRTLKGANETALDRYRGALATVPETSVVVSYENVGDAPGAFLDAVLDTATHGMPGMEDSARGAFRRTAELQNFGASLSYTVADERGVFTYSQSPTAGIGSMGGLQGLVVIASVVVPNLNATRMRANEEGALATLQAIRAAEETFRSGALRDSDGDGDGEFGTFDDLLGRARPGASRPLSSRPLLTLPFKRLEDGDLAHRGYRFRVYLPAEDGSPIGGQEGQARVDAIDGDLAEMIAIVIAWPEDEASGDLAYLMDASGTIWVCQCDGLYAGSKPVPPDVLSSQARNLASAPIRPGQRGRDGLYWHRTR